ncbi:MAG: chromate transporter [Comamonadaceae bacterium 32-67-11]|nr:MAG: chromate transporter [Comamonadaceae bacterium 32-67-11]
MYIGWLLHRTWGGIVAGVLFVLPSFFILAALTYVYLDFGDLTFVQGVFNGIKPAVVAIVAFAAWRIGSRALKNYVLWAMAALSFIAIFALKIPFPYIVLAAGLLGALGGKLMPDKFKVGGGHGASNKQYGPALIDDDTPPIAHTRFRWSYLITLLVVALALWTAAMLMLPAGTLNDMGEFFTKAALVTFGGAYAVLPFVYQGGVEHYQWLTGTQMIDGLALVQTMPGPLVMVASFVGFVGAWTKEIFGPDALLLAGFAGASVATFFTFLPSFVFILAGAPLVESTHGDLKFTAPLTGITAAVVGVILNLALIFGWYVIFPHATEAAPFSGGFEWFYALISVAAFIALWKYKQDVIKVIGACAAIGLVHTYIV